MGIYRFYQNGKLVGESHNVLTTEGRVAIYRHLAQGGGYASSIAVGLGNDAATINDEQLHFEVERVEILHSAPDFSEDTIIFKARLPKELQAEIREAGIYGEHETSGSASDVVLTFTDEEEWDEGTFESGNSRFGDQSLRLSAGNTVTTTATLVDADTDLSEASGLTVFKLAAFVADNNCGAITVQFRNDPSNYFELVATSPSSGYDIFEFVKKDADTEGNPSWANITEITVAATGSGGTTNVDFDAFRVGKTDIIDGEVLVSRSVLPSPVLKTDEAPMDVEYTLGVSIS